MNDSLRRAMADAKMTDGQLAARCRVDTKTVGRWLSDPNRVPHPRHRWAASEALGVDEAVLWPSSVRSAVKTGPDREMVSVYPYRSAAPASLWRSLITKATDDLYFGGYTNYFLWLEQANLGAALQRKAKRGCRVRFLLGDPESETTRAREREEDVPLTLSIRIQVTIAELKKLNGVEGIEARMSNEHAHLSVFRFDHDMIVTPLLAYRVGHDAPTLHLRRHQDDGIFDRFAAHADDLWERARPLGG